MILLTLHTRGSPFLPFFIGWFPNHSFFFCRGLSSSKRNRPSFKWWLTSRDKCRESSLLTKKKFLFSSGQLQASTMSYIRIRSCILFFRWMFLSLPFIKKLSPRKNTEKANHKSNKKNPLPHRTKSKWQRHHGGANIWEELLCIRIVKGSCTFCARYCQPAM